MIDRIKQLFAAHPPRVPAPVNHDDWQEDFKRRRERVESLERAVKKPRPHNPIVDRLIAPRPDNRDDQKERR